MAGRIAYLGNITTQGLVLDLDAGIKGSYPGVGTTWTDISNNRNNGTLTNGPTFTGSDYGAIVFDGINDFITGSVINTPNQLSVFCFKNPKPRVGSVYPSIISKWTNDAQGENRSWVVGSIPGGVDYLAISTNGTYTNTTVKRYEFSSSVSNNIWTQTGFTFNNGILTPYLNGAPVNYTVILNPSITSIHTSNIPYTLGYLKDGAYDTYFSGSIGNAQIYNQSLTQFQVWQNFNAYKSRYGISDIVTDGLVLNLDAGNPYSYLSGSSGTTWTNTVAVSSSVSGTLTNGPVYSNGAITFDGTDDYINIPHVFDISSGGVTWNLWFKLSSTAWSPLFSDWYTNQWSFNIQVYLGNITVGIRNSSGVEIGGGAANLYPVSINTIYNMCCTYDKTTKTRILYINGVLINSSSNIVSDSAIRNTTNNWSIGYKQDTGNSISGSVYNAQIYNRALSQTEITQNFNALRGRYGI